jgi:hypothetical protein
VSGSCWCSRKAENSNIHSLELATLRPCHGGAGGAEGDGVGPAGDSNPACRWERHMEPAHRRPQKPDRGVWGSRQGPGRPAAALDAQGTANITQLARASVQNQIQGRCILVGAGGLLNWRAARLDTVGLLHSSNF